MKTVIGIDYGTLAARGVLVDTANGNVLCSHTCNYPHGVMEGALASAQDYENALMEILEAVTPAQYCDSIAGICVDATSLTLVPLTVDGQVVGTLEAFRNEPQAQIKMWKRHTAAPQAEEALRLAKAMNEPFLGYTGGALSSEWMLPKLLEMRDEAPEAYRATDLALDLCDFLTLRLTGTLSRSAAALGFKCLCPKEEGFPTDAYLNALRPGFAEEHAHLLRGPVYGPGDRVGFLKEELCEKFGLNKDVAVASGTIDGHIPVCALGALESGDAVMTVGTSGVLMVQSDCSQKIEDIVGIAADAVVPGLHTIECGQSCVGDMLAWFIDNCLPAEVKQEAEEKGISVHTLLCSRIREPWTNRLMAADWWNGSRCVPCDLSLQGGIIGITLDTKPEDIYLTLLQAIVCGAREQADLLASRGITVKRFLATGGITGKNPLLMQEYANILGKDIQIGQVKEGPALGAAMYGAVAAGIFDSIQEAYAHMGVQEFVTVSPETAHREEYELLYKRNHTMRTLLRQLQHEVSVL